MRRGHNGINGFRFAARLKNCQNRILCSIYVFALPMVAVNYGSVFMIDQTVIRATTKAGQYHNDLYLAGLRLIPDQFILILIYRFCKFTVVMNKIIYKVTIGQYVHSVTGVQEAISQPSYFFEMIVAENAEPRFIIPVSPVNGKLNVVITGNVCWPHSNARFAAKING